jgi:hypothetical protein
LVSQQLIYEGNHLSFYCITSCALLFASVQTRHKASCTKKMAPPYRQVVLPNESELHLVVFPLLSRKVVFPNESVLPLVVLPLLSRQVEFPNESVLPLVVLPLLSRQVEFPNESVLPLVVLPLLSRHVEFPNESVLPRLVFPLLSRQVVLPKESDEHLVCATAEVKLTDVIAMKNKAIVVFKFI